jgi:ferritin-like metal-binding protein YciE
MQTIRELLIDEMRDLYDAEKQLVKALPKVVKASSNSELSEAVAEHLEQTRGHVDRLEQAFELLGQKAKSKPCAAMHGLIEEAQETMQKDMADPLLDSAIICAAQKVEHYEIAGYGTLHAWAEALGLSDVAQLLKETLEEEKAADEKLSGIAGEILMDAEALSNESEEEDDSETFEGNGGSPRKSASRQSASPRKQAKHS